MATKQETFDTVVAHLRKQGRKSEGKDFCLYRGADGLMCAAGCLIPDSKYRQDFEGLGCFTRSARPSGEPYTGNVVQNCLTQLGHDPQFVKRLQSIHDDVDIEYWEGSFEELAEEFELIYTAP